MKEIANDPKLVACCGLFCAACGAYRKDRCPGCAKNEKAKWCKVRLCCIEKKYATCAECAEFKDPKECKKFHNFFSRVIGFVLNSDRAASIARIREAGKDAYAAEMAAAGKQRLPRKKK